MPCAEAHDGSQACHHGPLLASYNPLLNRPVPRADSINQSTMAPIPYAGKGNDVELVIEDTQPRTPKISPRRLIITILLSLFTLSLLQKPLTHCYHRMSQHFCNQSHLSVEDRARKVLSSTPLIGKMDMVSAQPHAKTNTLDQMAISTYPWPSVSPTATISTTMTLSRLLRTGPYLVTLTSNG